MPPKMRSGPVLWLCLLIAGQAIADEAPEPDRPRLLDPIFKVTNPSKIERFFDELVGFDSGEESNRPKAPEFPEPVFFDLVRPLGDLKYGNELNYLFNSSTRNAPGLQVIELEYVFADWRAAEVDLSYFNGDLQIITPFYQRTLGVSKKRNFVHAYQLSMDIYPRSGFIGGSPVYLFSWKPDEESKFSTTIFVGANRTLIGGFNPSRAGSFASMLPPPSPTDKTYGSWRPAFNADFFYRFNEKFALGIENDFDFQSGRAAEYLSFPFLNYEAGEHAMIQVGGGYYHFESRDQFTFFLHLNLINRSPRKPRKEE